MSALKMLPASRFPEQRQRRYKGRCLGHAAAYFHSTLSLSGEIGGKTSERHNEKEILCASVEREGSVKGRVECMYQRMSEWLCQQGRGLESWVSIQ